MDIKTKSNESLEQLTREPIDVTEFLKNITETKIISIEDNIKEYLKTSNKQLTTLSEIKDYHNWAKPSGIKPDEAYTFDDIQKMVEDNPDKKFSKSDVWVNTSLIYIITKFNRVPQIPECLRHLDFTNGLNWEALDTPHYYLVKHNGRLVLCSTIGGHRGTMCVLSNGYNKNMHQYTPMRTTFALMDGKFFFLIRHGEHRISCLPHLGTKRATLWVRHSDVLHVDKNNAEMVSWFNSVYEGNLIGPPLTNVYGYFFV